MNWKIYEEGKEACKNVDNDCQKAINPYKKNSDEWKAWNKGWNSY